jgi:hypothetical protein
MTGAAPRLASRPIANGENGDVVEIANSAAVGRASPKDATGKRAQAAVSPVGDGLVPLTAMAASQWRALTECAVEPNGYHLPDW